MADFVTAGINANPTTIADDGIDSVNTNLAAAGFQGWTAQDASLAIILMLIWAHQLADVANAAGVVPNAIFRAFGTQLLGIRYQNGQSATVVATFTFTSAAPDNSSYTIDAGTQVIIDGQAFYLQNDAVPSMGATSIQGTLQASAAGSAFNGLGGVSVGSPRVQLNDEIDWISNVTTVGVTSNGADQEDDATYQNKLVNEVALQSPRPLIFSDFANLLLSDIAQQATGVAVGRATSIDGYYPPPRTTGGGTGPTSLTATSSLTSGSANVTSLAVQSMARGAIPAVGATVTGTGVPSSTVVLASPAPTATTFTMSHNASATGTPTLTINAWTSVPLANTSFVTDVSGQPLSTADLDALQAYLQSKQPQNWLTYVTSASYTTIYVTAQVRPLPGYDPTATAAAAANAIINYLNPKTWGTLGFTQTSAWLNSGDGFNVVRYNKLLGVIESVAGVDYVPSGSTGLSIGITASPSGTSDITMTGPAPLPQADLQTPTVIVTAV